MTSVEDTGVEMGMDQISCQMAALGMSEECQVTFPLGHYDMNTYTTLGVRGANMKTAGREEQDDCPVQQDDCRGGVGWMEWPAWILFPLYPAMDNVKSMLQKTVPWTWEDRARTAATCPPAKASGVWGDR